jgi:hypothetical protein
MTFWPRNRDGRFGLFEAIRLFMGLTEGIFIGLQVLRFAQGRCLVSVNE